MNKPTPEAFKPFDAVFKRGRFVEEWNVELYLSGAYMCAVKLFLGRPPYYRPWAEVFNLAPLVETPWEKRLYCMLYRLLEPGEVAYVEYVDDAETYAALRGGTPPAETRLGRLLEGCGFRVVRDLYFPEGWLEGGVKLQAARP
ncbi:MAG: DUF1122 family protein [Pyrobaculum sp.]